jgi:hypothetical protein
MYIRCVAILLLFAPLVSTSIAQEVNWRRVVRLDNVRDIAFSSNGWMYVLTADSAYRSSDAGSHWVPLNTGTAKPLSPPFLTITTNGVLLFAGETGVMSSADNGDTWTVAYPTTNGINGIVTDSSGYWYVAASEGVFRSADSGTHWEPIFVGVTYSLLIGPSQDILVGLWSGGARRSTDKGVSWEAYPLTATSLFRISTSRLIAGNCHWPFWGRQPFTFALGIFGSTDEGRTWNTLNSQPLYDFLVGENDQLFAGRWTGGVLTSTDGGVHWSTLNAGLIGNCVFALAKDLKGNVFAGTEEGVFKIHKTSPLSPSYHDFYVHPAGCDTNNGLGPSSPLGSIADALSRMFADSAHAQTIHVASGTYGPALTGEARDIHLKSHVTISGVSEDNVTLADTRIEVDSCTGVIIERMTVRGVISIQNCNPTLKHLKLRATNGSEGPGIYLYTCSPFMQDIEISGANGEAGILMYGSSPTLNNIIIHDNVGWLCGGIRIEENSNPILANVTVVGNSGGEMGGVSANAGSHPIFINTIVWNNSQPQIELRAFSNWNCSIAFTHCDIQGGEGDIHIVNFETGIATVDWLDSNLDSDPLFSDMTGGNLGLQIGSPCIDAGTAMFVLHGDTLVNMRPDQYVGQAPDIGAFESGKSSGIERGWSTPLIFALKQNYPNPFNPSTIIKYELPKASQVTLKVYDIVGREVSVLVNERRNAGVQEVKFKAAGLASGVYFYRMQTGDFIQTRKLLLVR